MQVPYSDLKKPQMNKAQPNNKRKEPLEQNPVKSNPMPRFEHDTKNTNEKITDIHIILNYIALLILHSINHAL